MNHNYISGIRLNGLPPEDSYKWKHSTLLSIVSGTAAYMLFLPLF